MKRYLVFKGHYHYPSGGWSDFITSYATFEEAQEKAQKDEMYKVLDETYKIFDGSESHTGYEWYQYEWYQIVDFETGEVFKGEIKK